MKKRLLALVVVFAFILSNFNVIAQQGGEFENKLIVAPTYYGNNGEIPFFVEMSGVPEGNYSLEVSYNENVLFQKAFTKTGSNYFVEINDEYQFTDNSGMELKLALKNSDENIVYEGIYTIEFISDPTIHIENSKKYIHINENSKSFEFSIFGGIGNSNISSIQLLDINNEIVMSSNILSTFDTYFFTMPDKDARYDKLFSNSNIPYVDKTIVVTSLYKVGEINLGKHSLKVIFDDGTSIISNSDMEVVNQAIVTNIHTQTSNFPRKNSSLDEVFVSLWGIGLNPEKEFPILLDYEGNTVSNVLEWRYLYQFPGAAETSAVYKLQVTSDTYFNVGVGAIDGHSVIDISNSAFFFEENYQIYYSELIKDTHDVAIKTTGFDGEVTVYLYPNNSSDTPLATTTAMCSDGEILADFSIDGDKYPFVGNTSYYLKVEQGENSSPRMYFETHGYDLDTNIPVGITTFNEIAYVGTENITASINLKDIDLLDTVYAKIYQGNDEITEGYIETNLSEIQINGKKEFNITTEINTQDWAVGIYNIKYYIDDEHINENRRHNIIVIGNDELYVSHIDSYYKDEDIIHIEVNTPNGVENYDLSKFNVEIQDIMGNVFEDYTFQNIGVEDNTYIFEVKNFPLNQAKLNVKIKYDDKEPIAVFVGLSNYYNTFLGYELEAYNETKTIGFQTGRTSYNVNGVQGVKAGSHVTLEIYRPFDTELIKTITFDSDRKLIPEELEDLDLNQRYFLVLLNEKGKVVETGHMRFLELEEIKIEVDGITLNPESLVLHRGTGALLVASIIPSDATNKEVYFTSSDTSVVTVDSDGWVTTVGEGEARITAVTDDGGFTAFCDITVLPPSPLKVNLYYSDESEIPIVSGQYKVDGLKLPVYEEDFEEETNKPLNIVLSGGNIIIEEDTTYEVVFELEDDVISSDEYMGIDIINGIELEYLRGEAIEDGVHTFTITVLDGENIIEKINLPIEISNSKIPVTGIDIKGTSIALNVGDVQQVNYVVSPVNATDKNCTWSSDDENVAVVDSQGLITAIGAGETTISVITQDRGYEDQLTVKVFATVEGTIKKDGDEVSGLWVYLMEGNRVISQRQTNEDGKYTFNNVLPAEYHIEVRSFDRRYSDIISDEFEVPVGATIITKEELEFESIYNKKGSLVLNFTDQDGNDYNGEDIEIHLYSRSADMEIRQAYTPENGKIIINELPYSDNGASYNLSVTTSSFWKHEVFNLDENTSTVEKNYVIPVRYSISGSVTSDNMLIINESVIAINSNGQYHYGYIDSEGNFQIRGLTPGEYKLGMLRSDKFLMITDESELLVEITDSNIEDISIEVKKGVDLAGNLFVNSVPAHHALLTLYRENELITSAFSNVNGFVFNEAIKESGNYELVVSTIRNQDGTYPEISPNSKSFVITDEDISSGRIMVDMHCVIQSLETIFSRQGNNVLLDKYVVKEGDKVTLVIRYKNNGSTAVDAEFFVTLPEGVSGDANDLAFSVSQLEEGKTGQVAIPLTIGDLSEIYQSISVQVKIDDNDLVDFGQTVIEKIDVTLNGPVNAEAGEVFKVYGEATKNSTIVIKDTITGRVLGTAKPSGRWYSTSISIREEGTYKLVAEVITDEGATSVISDILNVEITDDPIKIVDVKRDTHGASELPINNLIGVRTFTAWVDLDMKGFDIHLRTKFNKDNIESVTYHFCGNDYEATIDFEGYFNATLDEWYCTGLKTITATVITTDGRQCIFIIAEVTILIDPSGYITDRETGDVLEGVTVICEIYNEDSEEWEMWDAELYGQINPQISDENGYYGWMVHEGTYRVIALMDDYLYYVTTEDDYLESNQEIIIPPVRTDVDIALVPSVWVEEIIIINDESELTVDEKLQLTVEVFPHNAVNIEKVNWISDNDSVAEVNSEGEVTALSEGQVIITAYINSTSDDAVDGKIAATIELTINPKQTDSDDGDDSGGSGGSGDSGGSGGPAPPPQAGEEDEETTESEETLEEKLDSKGEFEITVDKLNELDELDIKGDVEITFNKEALINLKDGEKVSISVTEVDSTTLNIDRKDIIGNRPAYSFKANLDGQTISNFGEGLIRIAIPYMLRAGEDSNSILVYYVDDKGSLIPTISSYMNGHVKFITQHFSTFAVGYNKVDFSDVDGWYEDAVSFLSSREIISGVGNNLFEPQRNVTRAELARILASLAGADLSLYKQTSFNDVKDSDWFMPSVEWARDKGIVKGVGEGLFNPNALVTRQDLAVMINNYVNVMSNMELSTKRESNKFNDSESIASYANEAVSNLYRASVISGKPGNLYDPKGNATRAETAAMIQSLIKQMF
ncbi:UNVERIFIED_CONTAM: Bacterial surface proteins containing Ig-like domains [Acetivibrio alkalicellulosi]